jgi:hypothetical protein
MRATCNKCGREYFFPATLYPGFCHEEGCNTEAKTGSRYCGNHTPKEATPVCSCGLKKGEKDE